MSRSRTIAPMDFPARDVHPDASESQSIRYSDSPHIGLVWSRYLPAHVSLRPKEYVEWCCLELPDTNRDKNFQAWSGGGALKAFVHTMHNVQPSPDLARLHDRRDAVLAKLGSIECLAVKSDWRMTVGLGNPSTFENSGTTLHASYGFPVLPAASLKGIARHFLFEDPELTAIDKTHCPPKALDQLPRDEKLAELLFGKQNGNGPEDDDHLAAICLYDGWPLRKPDDGWFDVDVLTVHHRDYYQDKHDQKDFAVDSEGPNPVHFLTLRSDVAFRIPIGLTNYGQSLEIRNPQICLTLTREILRAALQYCGIGAKTASGYGRMSSPQS